ncbi:unnamed protein product [Urochloa decumbens]|uniref:Uncharacterized protein n=1 Tax=Urochloa decumbens TaxID=240449 RepID=A0ABC8WQZ9_9POAL
MMNRRFLNLVSEAYSTGVLSLRRIKLADHLFYPSTTAAESAMARSEAAIKANEKRQAGYKHGFRSLRARATSLGALPAARINFQPSGPVMGGDISLEFVTLLGDESKILCGDSTGGTSLYDADSHSIMTMHGLRASKGQDAISMSITRAANGYARQYDSLFVMNRTPDSDIAEYLLEELRYGSEDLFSDYPLIHRWKSLPPPPFIYRPAYEIPGDIGAYTVVGSTIYVSSVVPGIGTYSFDTLEWAWRHAGKWELPFYGKAEYVPELNLWFGLSASRPFHLCVADLSTLDFQRPPTVQHTWVDLDLPKNWEPFQLDFINLGSGRFCTVKTFLGTRPPLEVGFSDNEDDDNESIDLTDVIDWEFAVLTGIEVVPSCDGESPESVRMIKHKSRFYICADHSIKWVL